MYATIAITFSLFILNTFFLFLFDFTSTSYCVLVPIVCSNMAFDLASEYRLSKAVMQWTPSRLN